VAHIPVEQSVLYSARAAQTFMLLSQGDGVRRILQGRIGTSYLLLELCIESLFKRRGLVASQVYCIPGPEPHLRRLCTYGTPQALRPKGLAAAAEKCTRFTTLIVSLFSAQKRRLLRQYLQLPNASLCSLSLRWASWEALTLS
jgi:hypothetical protein